VAAERALQERPRQRMALRTPGGAWDAA
jgi:hypothetical protein